MRESDDVYQIAYAADWKRREIRKREEL